MLLKYYKQDISVPDLAFATEQSACFDLRANLLLKDVEIKGISSFNVNIKFEVKDNKISIFPKDRVMIPTGIILDIPENYCVKIYPRSSVAFKKGLTLVNSVGIIDSDYVDPVFLLMTNISDKVVFVEHGERLCQAEMVKIEPTEFSILESAPTQKTSRNGGIGSTGRI